MRKWAVVLCAVMASAVLGPWNAGAEDLAKQKLDALVKKIEGKIEQAKAQGEKQKPGLKASRSNSQSSVYWKDGEKPSGKPVGTVNEEQSLSTVLSYVKAGKAEEAKTELASHLRRFPAGDFTKDARELQKTLQVAFVSRTDE